MACMNEWKGLGMRSKVNIGNEKEGAFIEDGRKYKEKSDERQL